MTAPRDEVRSIALKILKHHEGEHFDCTCVEDECPWCNFLGYAENLIEAYGKKCFERARDEAAGISEADGCNSSGCCPRDEWHSTSCPIGIAEKIKALRYEGEK